MSSAPWTPERVPDLAGRTVVVTGANSGIGFEAARMLAAKGARTVLACRAPERAEAAATRIRERHPAASLEQIPLDLADLGSVRAAAAQLLEGLPRIDVLVNNAGVMALPFRRTADGFEMQFGTNHLGHFALTGLLMERILATPSARVVTISSGAHFFGEIDLEHLDDESRYHPWRAYARSKLANLLFALELARRLERHGADTLSVAAHPGAAATELPAVAPAMRGRRWLASLVRTMTPLVTQSARAGALPTVRAAADPDVVNGEYFGPTKLKEMRGPPERVRPSRRARDPERAARLWALSEERTGVRFPLPASS